MCPGSDIAHAAPAAGRAARATAALRLWRRCRAHQLHAVPPSRRGRSAALRGAQKVYPQHVQGTYRRIKWVVLLATLGIYYLLPFVRWDRGPNAPSQAVLIDLPEPALLFLLHRDLAAGSLLPHRPSDPRGDGAVPDERGRRPGLVRLSLPADGVDRSVPGDRALGPRATGASICSATGSRGPRTDSATQALKHFLWLMVAWWTGGAWVLYFADAPTWCTTSPRSRRRSSPTPSSAF